MLKGVSKLIVGFFCASLILSMPINPMAITTQNGAFADPNVNIPKSLVFEERGKDYFTQHYSDGTGTTTFGLPEWIEGDNGYVPYQVFENTNTFVIESQHLPLAINKNDCTTAMYLPDTRILDGAGTLIEKEYWQVHTKETSSSSYSLLDTSSWDCNVTINQGDDLSVFATWTKSHGDETLSEEFYDTVSTNSTGTFYFRNVVTEETVIEQQTITNSTGTFSVNVPTTVNVTTSVPVIPNEIISTFQTEYRYLLDEGEVETFTRITNNDPNYENHIFGFFEKMEGVNYDAFGLGDDIEFTDDTFIGTYTATAENVPEKYIKIAEQGYPLFYSLKKAEDFWSGASAEIYMSGANKKLNVGIDFGENRSALPLNTLQELDPTFSYTNSDTVKRTYDGGTTASSCGATGTSTDTTGKIQRATSSGEGTCQKMSFQWDLSSITSPVVVTDSDFKINIATVSNMGSETCSVFPMTYDLGSATVAQIHTDASDGTAYVSNIACSSTGDKTVDLGSSGDTDVATAINGDQEFEIGFFFTTQTRDTTTREATTGTPQLTLTYETATVTGAPTSLSATGASTSQINLSWTAPDTSASTVPAVSGYRIQNSTFAFANSTLPEWRTGDSDTYGSIDGAVDMATANLYLGFNGTKKTFTLYDDLTSSSGWTSNDESVSDGGAVVTSGAIDFKMTGSNTVDNIAYELPNIASSTWVLRWDVLYDGFSSGSDGENHLFGLTSGDHTIGMANPYTGSGGSSTSEDRITFAWASYDADERVGIETSDGVYSNAYSDTGAFVDDNLDVTGNVKYYMELKRVSDTTVKLDIKTGSHDGDSKTGYPVTSTSASSNVKDLKYIKLLNRAVEDSRSGYFTGDIDNVQFCDGTSTFSDCMIDSRNTHKDGEQSPQTIFQDQSLQNNHAEHKGASGSITSLDTNLNFEGTNSANFNGVDNYLAINTTSAIIPTSSAFTLGTWIQPDIINSTSTYKQTIFSYPTSAGTVDFNIEGDDLEFRSGDSNNDPIIARTHGMNSDSWNNVAVSRDSSNNFEIFVNGTRVGAVASNSTALGSVSSGEANFVGSNGGTSNFFNGKMDEMYVLASQSDTVIDNISSRGENTWTDLSYNTGGTGTTYSHSTIVGGGGTEQAYRVSAHNSVGIGAYDLVLGETASTPSAPQNLAVSPQMNGDTHEQKLTWSNPSSEGASSISNFKVYRGTSSGFTANSGSLVTTLGDVFTYTDSGLNGRTAYYYIVSAVNTQGEGTKTSEVSATTKNFNVVVKAVRNDNTTAITSGYVYQTNSTSVLNQFALNSTGFNTPKMTGLYGNQNFTISESSNNFVIKEILNSNIAQNKVGSSFINAQTNIFDVDCSSNGSGTDVRLYVNSTVGHQMTSTTPSCSSSDVITWDNVFTANGAVTNAGTGDHDSKIIAEILSTDKYGVNADSLVYNTTNTVTTTYSAPKITSGTFTVGSALETRIFNFTLDLGVIEVESTPSGGGGGGGNIQTSGGGIMGGLQEFIEESFEFSMATKVHKVELGQTITDSITVTWNQPEEVKIMGIDAGRYNSWFGFQKTPFTLLGSSDGFSTSKIPYKIRVPDNYCENATGQTLCAEAIIYQIPVVVTGKVNDEIFKGNAIIKIDLSKTVQPALFAVFLAFTGGIGAIIYRARSAGGSRKPTGKRESKKKGSFLSELSKNYNK